MDSKTPTDKAQSLPETVVQQPMLQQVQAAVAAQTDYAGSMRQQVPPQAISPIVSDVTEEDIPPPTYGEIYGEVSNEKNGVGTRARVTEDGRVNIRINQVNRRLSQIFTPALRQEVGSAQEGGPLPLPYIPPSLGGEKGVLPPPILNIVIQVVGSRGDVQPFIALGKVLRETYGHRVRLATHPNFKDFVQENGLEFFSIGGDPSRLMAFMVKNPRLMPGSRSLLNGDVGQRRRDVAEYIQGCWRSCFEAGDGMSLRAAQNDALKPSENDPGSDSAARPFVADCIIANPPSFAHIHCAEKLGIPLHIVFTMPYTPTQAFPHPLANIQSSNADPQLTNYMSYVMIEVLSWQGLGDIINRFRAKCLGLDPVSQIWAPGMLQRLKIPHTYCWSPALIPKPKDWGPHISICGFNFLNLASNYIPDPDLQSFLDAGPAPVYIGFGSIVLDNPDAMTELIFEAVRITGRRVVVSKGWGGIGVDKIGIPDNVFMLDNVPHDWLFKHVSCVVHHGGAGTTAAGIAAGRPTFIVPFFGDQAFWGAMIARAGAGPNPISHKQLTAEKLANAITFCLKPETLERAQELASKIAVERGSDAGAQSFHQQLEPDRLRCNLAPSRPAVWRIKRTQVKLSAFATCTLVNANLLEFQDLKLFRPQEYHTDEGPWDPVSGGAAACYRAFSGMAMGLAEVPSETMKAFRIPVGYKQPQSQELVPIAANEGGPAQVGERSTPLILREQSQRSLNLHESFVDIHNPSKPSSLPHPNPDHTSSSISNVPQHQPSSERDDTGRGGVGAQNESIIDKDHDMLRQTGAHTSKGLGRFVKAFVQTPVEVSAGLTKGFHNLPKLWGDDTVRPHEQVRDFKSGAMAAGKEFGYGWYDGVTGLVTQPWKGAQKDGASGFLKGVGKGVVGFATKPLAGFSGVLGHTLKGVQKQVEKLFGSNVQNYIVASRVAQGYEEWLQSSDAEKEDVLLRWKLIQKNLKEISKIDQMRRDVLEAQQTKSVEDAVDRQNYGYTTGSTRSTISHTSTPNPETAIPALGSPQPDVELLGGTNVDESARPTGEILHRNVEKNAHSERAVQGDFSKLQFSQQEAVNHQADPENLRQVIAASEVEAQQYAAEALEFKRQLELAMAQSVLEQ